MEDRGYMKKKKIFVVLIMYVFIMLISYIYCSPISTDMLINVIINTLVVSASSYMLFYMIKYYISGIPGIFGSLTPMMAIMFGTIMPILTIIYFIQMIMSKKFDGMSMLLPGGLYIYNCRRALLLYKKQEEK